MSLFAVSSWDADAVGDKLSKQFYQKGKKKNKKRKKNCEKADLDVSASKNKKQHKKHQSENAVSETKQNMGKRKRSNSVVSEDGPGKKLKKMKPSTEETTSKNGSRETSRVSKKYKAKKNKQPVVFPLPSKELVSSKNVEPVISKKVTNESLQKRENIKERKQQTAVQQTKSQMKRKKRKLKMNALKANNLKPESNTSEKFVDKSSGKVLNLHVIEKMLMKNKTKNNDEKKVKKEPESLRERMMGQLRASRFRYINETLYNNESFESKKFFNEDPEAFTAYHTGYRQQVEQWPVNPLDVIIASIKKMPKEHIIADFGCGEARLAESVPQKVHSFDLVAVNDKVKACDMAHTPLLMNGCNVVVFCLSLMGTNLADYLMEANRVLKQDGILKIADVESRFENVDDFISLLRSYGFVNTWKDLEHNLFYFMDFKKVSEVDRKSKKLPQISLKPCLYKKR